MNNHITALAPDAPHPRDPRNIGGGNDAPRYRRAHAGMTALERLLYGVPTQEDVEHARAANDRHQAWKRSPEGQAWLAAQPWHRAEVRL